MKHEHNWLVAEVDMGYPAMATFVCECGAFKKVLLKKE